MTRINGLFSQQWIPQGQVLGQFYFNLLVYDLELEVSSVLARFAHDTELFMMVKPKADCEDLLEYLHKLGEWAIVWKIKFTVVVRKR